MWWEDLVLLLRLGHDVFSRQDGQCNMVKEVQNLVSEGLGIFTQMQVVGLYLIELLRGMITHTSGMFVSR